MSVGFVLNFYNNTDVEAVLTAKVGSWDDWESKTERNPEVAIKGLRAPAHQLTPVQTGSAIHLERSNGVATAPFTVTADIGGVRLEFQLDGCDATNMHDRDAIPVSAGGSEFMVLQVPTVKGEIDNGHPDFTMLSVFIAPRVEPERWMAHFPNSTLMSLNIPGSHDTGTYGGSGVGCSKCQTLDIAHQLRAGVRFLDLRLRFYPNTRADDLEVYHGLAEQGVWLKEHILPAVNQFLKANPTECVIFCVAQDSGKGSPLDGVLHDILVQGLPANALYDANTDVIVRMTLGDLKGKVVLLRQDRPQTFGVDVSNWPDDNANSSTDFAPIYAKSGKVITDKNGKVAMAGSIRMQNAYEYGITTSYGIGEKWKNVKAHLVRAEQSHPRSNALQWWLNWTNASHTPPTENWCPWGFAYGGGAGGQYAMRGVNFLLAQHLILNTKPGACRVGTVVMDYVEEPKNNTLIKLLLAWNRLI